MRIPEENSRPAEINIVPLIDVIFSILVFFIIASLVLTRSEALDVNLPDASTAQSKLQPDATISVTKDGVIAVNRQEVSIDGLKAAVEKVLAETKPENPAKKSRLVVINADSEKLYGDVVRVMDTLQQIPDVELAIAAQRSAP
ncbi:MAG: biopolymer transporter ExbD [Cyanobacteriota bacterium]|nr:biopolymer transporter ExbD [Cyanobacteriota bacterium]